MDIFTNSRAVESEPFSFTASAVLHAMQQELQYNRKFEFI